MTQSLEHILANGPRATAVQAEALKTGLQLLFDGYPLKGGDEWVRNRSISWRLQALQYLSVFTARYPNASDALVYAKNTGVPDELLDALFILVMG